MLGPLGLLYNQLLELLRKEGGCFNVQHLSSAFRARFGKDLSYAGSGVNNLDDFVDLFYSEFMLCGDHREARVVLLIPYLLERIASSNSNGKWESTIKRSSDKRVDYNDPRLIN